MSYRYDYTRLRHAELQDIAKRESKLIASANLFATDISRINFEGFTFYTVQMTHANAVGCNFRNIVTENVTWLGANLCFCDFRGADLRGSNFRQANLTCALLAGADVRGCSFKDAFFYGPSAHETTYSKTARKVLLHEFLKEQGAII